MRVLLKKYSQEYQHHDQLWYWCPGCKTLHAIGTGPKHHKFNGDYENPTFEPSCLHSYPPQWVCHSFIRKGYIQFLNDCTHELKGQTILLPHIHFNEDESNITPE